MILDVVVEKKAKVHVCCCESMHVAIHDQKFIVGVDIEGEPYVSLDCDKIARLNYCPWCKRAIEKHPEVL